MAHKKQISLVIPIYNEEETIQELYQNSKTVLNEFYPQHEIIIVDDGSVDRSFSILEELVKQDERLKVIQLTKNFGQAAAMMAGIQFAEKEIIVTMDGDLQNDSLDIPRLVDKLEDGFDLVCGWRKDRHDALLTRKIPSWIANKLINYFSGILIHDNGCTLRAYKAKMIKNIRLYGEMHRFIPALVAREGGRITELVVQHHHREKGISKYGIERIFKVFLDMFVLKFMSGYATRPIHFFGFFGIFSIGFGVIIGLYTLYQRVFLGLPGINLLTWILLVMMLFLVGGQTILIGLLAEICIRTYYESQDKVHYNIKKTISGDS